MAHSSRKAVLTAIASNAVVTVIKFVAAAISGSAAMMNEAIHSLMDTLNQGFLFLGLREADRAPDQRYAFGHGQKKYLWNLWSAIGLFSIGSGLGLSHAWHSWQKIDQLEELEPFTLMGTTVDPLLLNLLVLATAFLLEGYSFLVAGRQYLAMMRRDGHHNPFRYLLQADDPTLVAVVLEDSVAMLGLVFAAIGIGLTAYTGDHLWDILFSGLIAIMLGVIAFYLGFTNMRFLADMRDREAETRFQKMVEAHPEVERCHDLRSIILDERHTLLVAEIEIREEALIPGLREQIEAEQARILGQLPATHRSREEVRCYAAARAAAQATLARTELIIDELVAAIKQAMPRVSHVTLEIQGIASPPDPPA